MATTTIRIEDDLKARIAATAQRIGDILEVIQILTHSPQIGWPVKDGKRELVIGRAIRAHVALYRLWRLSTPCLCWRCGRSGRKDLCVKNGCIHCGICVMRY